MDILCPDDFDVSVLGGTIVKSDGLTPLHEWMGHQQTPMVIDKQGTEEITVNGTDGTKGEVIADTK